MTKNDAIYDEIHDKISLHEIIMYYSGGKRGRGRGRERGRGRVREEKSGLLSD
jgi:hypothetical protein